ncbi:hypothetical protein FAY30_15810 [Bacillus sp. S3]|uniref:YpoC family protein n=1 Tax=Bacillus sp. S3 TaxID=486398 RepID=UPI0011888A92|nr:hypothetical protein [Bacillus sp. S3]QCJ43247.1 hypothetical protein FAY30_15810 [Bacillus sp. S3]
MDNLAEAVSSVLKEWEQMKARLDQLFRERDQKNANDLMKKGITLFIQFLHYTNVETSIPNRSLDFDQLSFKPVNIRERLGFIMARPGLYHSYRQLSELMVELEKLYAKKNIKNKSRPKA